MIVCYSKTMTAIDLGTKLNLGIDTQTNTNTYINTYPTIFSLFSVILKNVYVLAAVILFIMVFVGGLGMIINAGNTEKQKQSSQTLSSAVLGFAIMFLSYWLIKIIELITGVKILSLT